MVCRLGQGSGGSAEHRFAIDGEDFAAGSQDVPAAGATDPEVSTSFAASSMIVSQLSSTSSAWRSARKSTSTSVKGARLVTDAQRGNDHIGQRRSVGQIS